MKKILLLFMILIWCASNAYSTDYYLSRAASGANNGGSAGDWNDAWQNSTDIDWSVLRGNTLYVSGHAHVLGDSTYEKMVISQAASGTAIITIKKATAGEHGTEEGWKAGFGTNAAAWEDTTTANKRGRCVFIYGAPYITIDGVTGTGSDSTSYGFRFSQPDSAYGDECSLLAFENATNNIIIKHVDFKHSGMENVAPDKGLDAWGDPYGYNTHNIYSNSSSHTDVTIQDCLFREVNQMHIYLINGANWTIEDCFFMHRSYYISNPHGEPISIRQCDSSANIIVRYNSFMDNSGTSCIAIQDSDNDGIQIYCNEIYSTGATMTNGQPYYYSNPTIGTTGSYNFTNIEIYNNTLVGINNLGPTSGFTISPGSGNIAYNNVFYSNSDPITFSGIDSLGSNFSETSASDDCDLNIGSDPFRLGLAGAIAAGNFDLSVGSDPDNGGADLSAIFTVDIQDSLYGSDGDWEGGAYAVGSDPPEPTAPRNPKTFYISELAEADGAGTSAAPFQLLATAQDSMTRGEDKLVVRGEIKGQFTAPAESLTIESDADTLGILSGIVTVADDFETSGGGVTQATNDVADDDCYFNQTYYEEWDSNDILMTGDAFADSSSLILKVNIPADYASSDSVTLRLPDVGQGGEMPRINLYIEDKLQRQPHIILLSVIPVLPIFCLYTQTYQYP
jgi:hypothetical protein